MNADDADAYVKMLEAARMSFLAFLRTVWWMPHPLQIGRHTRAICERLTRAVADFEKGKSTFLLINVPFRHGKSDLVSRAFPAWFLGCCSKVQPSVIMSGYGASLVETFSRQTKAIIRGHDYQEIFPDVRIDPKRDSVDSWGVEGSAGVVTVVGLGGAVTGKGGNLIVLDDYCKSREEAYSDVVREKMWHAFSADLMTRRNAPASIVIVCATPWHPDDISGRIHQAMLEDPAFPRFEDIVFPARKPGEYEYLFPELYPPEWYQSERATLGPTMAAALLDCAPVGEGNRAFKDEWIAQYETVPGTDQMNRIVLVDSANSKNKTSDYTTMLVVGLARDRNWYLLDAVHDRLSLSERIDTLFSLVERWTPKCTFWEQVGAMCDVDALRIEQDRRGWHFQVTALKQTVPKEDRIRWLQPIFEARRMWIPNKMLRMSEDGRAYDFVHDFLEHEYRKFPVCAHDDMLDALANVMHPQVQGAIGFPVAPWVADERRPAPEKRVWKPWD